MHKPNATRYLTMATVAAWLACCVPGFCQAIVAEAASSAANAPQADSYKSAIQELRELGQVVHHIHQTSNDLATEASQPIDMVGEIDIIGGQVIPILPATAEGFGPTQYMAPRKKYLDLYMAHLSNLLPLLNDEINTLVVPAYAQGTVSPMVAKMKSWAADIQQDYTALQASTAGPKFVNKDIRTQADAITETIKGIDKLRHDIYKEMRRDEKSAGG